MYFCIYDFGEKKVLAAVRAGRMYSGEENPTRPKTSCPFLTFFAPLGLDSPCYPTLYSGHRVEPFFAGRPRTDSQTV